MSSCLKCERCPGFSPQFYRKHKCVNCYCGVVHHRSFHRIGHLHKSLDSADGSAVTSAGVTQTPFIWARHQHRSRANVVEVCVTVADLDISRVKRSAFLDQSKLQRAARRVTASFGPGYVDASELRGSWFVTLTVHGFVDGPLPPPSRNAPTKRRKAARRVTLFGQLLGTGSGAPLRVAPNGAGKLKKSSLFRRIISRLGKLDPRRRQIQAAVIGVPPPRRMSMVSASYALPAYGGVVMNPQRLRLVREVDGDYVRSRLETVAEEGGDDEDEGEKQSQDSASDDDSRGKSSAKTSKKRGSKGDIFAAKKKTELDDAGRARGPSFSQRFLSMASGGSGGKRARAGSDGSRDTTAATSSPVLDPPAIARTTSLTEKPRGSFSSAASSGTKGEQTSSGLMGAIRKASKSLRLPKGVSFSNGDTGSARGSVAKDGDDPDDEISQAVDEIMRARRASAGIDELSAVVGGSDAAARPMSAKVSPQSGNVNVNSPSMAAEGMDSVPKRSGRYTSTEMLESTGSVLRFRKAIVLRLPCDNNFVADSTVTAELYFEAHSGNRQLIGSATIKTRELLGAAKAPIRRGADGAMSREDRSQRNAGDCIVKKLSSAVNADGTFVLHARRVLPRRIMQLSSLVQGTELLHTFVLPTIRPDRQLVVSEEVVEPSYATQVPSQYLKARLHTLRWQKRVLEAKLKQITTWLHERGVVFELKSAEVANPLLKLDSPQHNSADGADTQPSSDAVSTTISASRHGSDASVGDSLRPASSVTSRSSRNENDDSTADEYKRHKYCAEWIHARVAKFSQLIEQYSQFADTYNHMFFNSQRHGSRTVLRECDALTGRDEILQSSRKGKGLVRKSDFFKSSALKGDDFLRAIPTNLHMQIMQVEETAVDGTALDGFGRDPNAKKNKAQPAPGQVKTPIGGELSEPGKESEGRVVAPAGTTKGPSLKLGLQRIMKVLNTARSGHVPQRQSTTSFSDTRHMSFSAVALALNAALPGLRTDDGRDRYDGEHGSVYGFDANSRNSVDRGSRGVSEDWRFSSFGSDNQDPSRMWSQSFMTGRLRLSTASLSGPSSLGRFASFSAGSFSGEHRFSSVGQSPALHVATIRLPPVTLPSLPSYDAVEALQPDDVISDDAALTSSSVLPFAPGFPPSPQKVQVRNEGYEIGGIVAARRKQFELSQQSVGTVDAVSASTIEDDGILSTPLSPLPAPLDILDLAAQPPQVNASNTTFAPHSPSEVHRSVSQLDSGVTPDTPQSHPPHQGPKLTRRRSSASVSAPQPSSMDHLRTFTDALTKIQHRFRHSGNMSSVYETVTFGVPAYHAKDAQKGGLANQRLLLPGIPASVMASSFVDHFIRIVCADVLPFVPRVEPMTSQPPVVNDSASVGSGSTGAGKPESVSAPHAVPEPTVQLPPLDPTVDPLPVDEMALHTFEVAANMQYREDIVLAQVLAAVISAFTFKIDMAVASRRRQLLELLATSGYLVQVESLLSTFEKETAMLEDLIVAVELLSRVKFRLVRGKESASKRRLRRLYAGGRRLGLHSARAYAATRRRVSESKRIQHGNEGDSGSIERKDEEVFNGPDGQPLVTPHAQNARSGKRELKLDTWKMIVPGKIDLFTPSTNLSTPPCFPDTPPVADSPYGLDAKPLPTASVEVKSLEPDEKSHSSSEHSSGRVVATTSPPTQPSAASARWKKSLLAARFLGKLNAQRGDTTEDSSSDEESGVEYTDDDTFDSGTRSSPTIDLSVIGSETGHRRQRSESSYSHSLDSLLHSSDDVGMSDSIAPPASVVESLPATDVDVVEDVVVDDVAVLSNMLKLSEEVQRGVTGARDSAVSGGDDSSSDESDDDVAEAQLNASDTSTQPNSSVFGFATPHEDNRFRSKSYAIDSWSRSSDADKSPQADWRRLSVSDRSSSRMKKDSSDVMLASLLTPIPLSTPLPARAPLYSSQSSVIESVGGLDDDVNSLAGTDVAHTEVVAGLSTGGEPVDADWFWNVGEEKEEKPLRNPLTPSSEIPTGQTTEVLQARVLNSNQETSDSPGKRASGLQGVNAADAIKQIALAAAVYAESDSDLDLDFDSEEDSDGMDEFRKDKVKRSLKRATAAMNSVKFSVEHAPVPAAVPLIVTATTTDAPLPSSLTRIDEALNEDGVDRSASPSPGLGPLRALSTRRFLPVLEEPLNISRPRISSASSATEDDGRGRRSSSITEVDPGMMASRAAIISSPKGIGSPLAGSGGGSVTSSPRSRPVSAPIGSLAREHSSGADSWGPLESFSLDSEPAPHVNGSLAESSNPEQRSSGIAANIVKAVRRTSKLGSVRGKGAGVDDVTIETGKVDAAKLAFAAAERDTLMIDISVAPGLYDLLPKSIKTQPISVNPVLFTMGINEQQTIANRIGDTSIQLKINATGFEKLSKYVDVCGPAAVGMGYKKLQKDMNSLRAEIQSEGKHPRVLTIAADIVRSLHGSRLTCCKSGKDRTGMSVTLEEARILEQRHGLPSDQLLPTANLFREHGTRLVICHKNTGKPKYAFNSVQAVWLPRMYQPPEATRANAGEIDT